MPRIPFSVELSRIVNGDYRDVRLHHEHPHPGDGGAGDWSDPNFVAWSQEIARVAS